MANEQNLKPVRTESEARELGRKGGIASGAARRKKKSIAELTMLVANASISGERLDATESVVGSLEDDERPKHFSISVDELCNLEKEKITQ